MLYISFTFLSFEDLGQGEGQNFVNWVFVSIVLKQAILGHLVAQVMIPGPWDRVPYLAACLAGACFSLSVSLLLSLLGLSPSVSDK